MIRSHGRQWDLPYLYIIQSSLQWRHNDHDSVSNHQPHGCLLNRLFKRRSKKTSKLRVTGLCVGNSPGPVNSPLKGPVTRKMFPFDDVIMLMRHYTEKESGGVARCDFLGEWASGQRAIFPQISTLLLIYSRKHLYMFSFSTKYMNPGYFTLAATDLKP